EVAISAACVTDPKADRLRDHADLDGTLDRLPATLALLGVDEIEGVGPEELTVVPPERADDRGALVPDGAVGIEHGDEVRCVLDQRPVEALSLHDRTRGVRRAAPTRGAILR